MLTKATRDSGIREWRRHVRHVTGPLEQAFAEAYRREMQKLREAIRERGRSPFDRAEWAARTALAMRPFYDAAVRAGVAALIGPSDRTLLGARKRPRGTVTQDITRQLSKRIADTIATTYDAVESILAEAKEDNLDADEIRDLIDEEWSDVLGRRADLIGVTEVAGAVNSARDYVMRQVVDRSQWVTADDERVRPTHVIYGEAGAKPVGFDWASLVRGTDYHLLFPGDPECTEPGEIINCRCILVPAEPIELSPDQVEGFLDDFGMTADDLVPQEDMDAQFIPNPYKAAKEFDPSQARDESGRWTSTGVNYRAENEPLAFPRDAAHDTDLDELSIGEPRPEEVARVEARTAALRESVEKRMGAPLKLDVQGAAAKSPETKALYEYEIVAGLATMPDAFLKRWASEGWSATIRDAQQVVIQGQTVEEGGCTDGAAKNVAIVPRPQDGVSGADHVVTHELGHVAMNFVIQDLGDLFTRLRSDGLSDQEINAHPKVQRIAKTLDAFTEATMNEGGISDYVHQYVAETRQMLQSFFVTPGEVGQNARTAAQEQFADMSSLHRRSGLELDEFVKAVKTGTVKREAYHGPKGLKQPRLAQAYARIYKLVYPKAKGKKGKP